MEELVKVVARPGGGLEVGRKLPGRGAWLCAGSLPCVEAAARKRALATALRSEVSAGAVEALRSTVADRARMGGRGVSGTQDEKD